jgi:precorrin-2 dehydrogenase/sirohydrochlorin ferrochelatase
LTQYYPVFLNINAKKCVVVGGGQVALRKVIALLERKANVEVISPELCSELNKLAKDGQIQVTRRHYQPGDLQGALVAIAATDDHYINTMVAQEAQSTSVLINVVDDANHSNFIVPSCICRGDLTIAISTSSKSPALARKLRTRIENDLGDEYASLILLIDEVRNEIKRQKIKVSSDSWQEALDLDLLLELIRKGKTEKAKITLLKSLKAQQE